MTVEEIKEKVVGIVVDRLGVDRADVTDDANLEWDLGADSIDKVELVMEYEHAFGINIPDDEFYQWSTVLSTVESLQRLLGVN